MAGVRVDYRGVLWTPASASVITRLVRPTLLLAADLVSAEIRTALRGHQNTGQFGQSLRPVFADPAPGVFTVTVTGSPAILAAVLEGGRRPGARPPPTAVIAVWARRKLRVTQRDLPSVAFLIARAIGRRGLPALRIFTIAAAAARPKVTALVRRMTATLAAELSR